ncbi:MAG: DUF3426 domain-containing protein, partial [Deltaproteobacteria bacterium]|nr:DUF3426 domain-containing protein [Deltaproteobacteria bacterium]
FIGKEEVSFIAPSKIKKGVSLGRIILLVFLLLVAGGGGFLYLQGGADTILNLASNLLTTKEALSGKLDITGLKHYFVENPSTGRLLVVEGKVLSTFEGPKEIGGVKGSILDNKGKPLRERIVPPGRIISGEELKTITREELEKRFREPMRGSIPPRGSIPFMVVFQDIPGDLAEFTVEVIQ